MVSTVPTPWIVAVCMVDVVAMSEYVAVVTWRLGDVILHQSCWDLTVLMFTFPMSGSMHN